MVNDDWLYSVEKPTPTLETKEDLAKIFIGRIFSLPRFLWLAGECEIIS
jgi:hypothetical protein